MPPGADSQRFRTGAGNLRVFRPLPMAFSKTCFRCSNPSLSCGGVRALLSAALVPRSCSSNVSLRLAIVSFSSVFRAASGETLRAALWLGQTSCTVRSGRSEHQLQTRSSANGPRKTRTIRYRPEMLNVRKFLPQRPPVGIILVRHNISKGSCRATFVTLRKTV
jgi:hypothetical protein